MGKNSNIEWTDHTFNPWIGCTRVGPGCDHCYAEQRMDTRLHVVQWGAGQPRKRTSFANWKEPLRWQREAKAFHDTYGRRQRVFCSSLADVFDNEVDPQWRADLFDLTAKTPDLDWLFLTKRIGNATRLAQQAFDALGWMERQHGTMPPNVWIGATIVNQEEADRDIPKLLAVPARVRFLSMEPLLGPVDLGRAGGVRVECGNSDSIGRIINQREAFPDGDPDGQIDWVIVGGESGPGARPMHPDWARSLRDQCQAAGVPFLFKQWGEHAPNWFNDDAGNKIPGSEWIDRMGKKAAGRTLDGMTHDGFPGDLFADFPKIVPGRITYGMLRAIIEWRDRHGIGDVSMATLEACQAEGHGAAAAGLELGLIDYGQASGQVD